MLYHPVRDIMTLVHGDDYASAGNGEQMRWLQVELEKRFDIKTTVLGTEAGDLKEGKILNRVLRVTEAGWELEADPRHADLFIEQLHFDGSKPVTTPGIEDTEEQQGDEQELRPWEVREYFGVAARGNYLGADRPDVQFAVKEACRDMSAPTQRSLWRMRRVVRYLVGAPRLVWKYQWQPETELIEVFADANFAGCKLTRKSTSGRGTHVGRSCH